MGDIESDPSLPLQEESLVAGMDSSGIMQCSEDLYFLGIGLYLVLTTYVL